jgi:hypothetical protein
MTRSHVARWRVRGKSPNRRTSRTADATDSVPKKAISLCNMKAEMARRRVASWGVMARYRGECSAGQNVLSTVFPLGGIESAHWMETETE